MRRSGRTIRIVDQLVQDYFTNGYFIAKDHDHESGPSMDRNRQVYKKVAERLWREHGVKIGYPLRTKNGGYIFEKDELKETE